MFLARCSWAHWNWTAGRSAEHQGLRAQESGGSGREGGGLTFQLPTPSPYPVTHQHHLISKRATKQENKSASITKGELILLKPLAYKLDKISRMCDTPTRSGLDFSVSRTIVSLDKSCNGRLSCPPPSGAANLGGQGQNCLKVNTGASKMAKWGWQVDKLSLTSVNMRVGCWTLRWGHATSGLATKRRKQQASEWQTKLVGCHSEEVASEWQPSSFVSHSWIKEWLRKNETVTVLKHLCNNVSECLI